MADFNEIASWEDFEAEMKRLGIDKDSSYAEQTLLMLLDDKTMSSELKSAMRNIGVPMIEIIEATREGEKMINNLQLFQKILASAMIFGISRCARPGHEAELTEWFAGHYRHALLNAMSLLTEANKKIDEMDRRERR